MTPAPRQTKTLSQDTDVPEEILARLLLCGAVKIATHHATIHQNKQTIDVGTSILPYTELSGVFAPEPMQRTIDHSELKNLWDCVKDPDCRGYGLYWWACLTINQKPLTHIVTQLKVVGVWCDILEQLPDNVFEAEIPKDKKLFH